MTKRWIFIFLCIMHVHVPAQSQMPSLSQLFIEQSDTFVIEPSWAISIFLSMNVQEFKNTWIFFVKMLISKPERFVHAYESHYTDHKCRGVLIGQCHVYDLFLSHLFVNLKTNTVFYSLQRPVSSDYISIFDYAQQSDLEDALYDFYAFYFDKLAAHYIEQINNAALNCAHIDFIQYKKQAQKTLCELYMVDERLQGSEYEARYGANLKNYQDIFQMLMAEKHQLENV